MSESSTAPMLCAGAAIGRKQLVFKSQVTAEARAAVEQGIDLVDACRYPLASEAGRHFWATYWTAKDEAQR